MNIDDCKKHFGFKHDKQLVPVFNVAPPTITKYRTEGIPIGLQAILQIQTKGKLKADPPIEPINLQDVA